ncbi:ATP-binding protein [Paraglaciecola aestuariivivens]
MNFLDGVKSFKSKLMVVIVGITFIVLLLSSLVLSFIFNNNVKKNLEISNRSNLAILAYNLAPAIAFADIDEANKLLASFKTSPDVVLASVHLLEPDGQLSTLVHYATAVNMALPQDVREFESGEFNAEHFQLTVPITADNEVIGYLYSYSIFSQLVEFERQMLAIFTATLLICLLFGTLISLRFQRILLAPLSNLVNATKVISQQKDFSVRVKQEGEDEFSVLSQSFNIMLDEIEQHHRKQLEVEEQIRQLNLNLEHKVVERTSQLEGANQYLKNAMAELERSNIQLIEQEKMASLGGLVAGIAHEINTPVGIGVTAISHLNHLLKQLDEKFQQNAITKSFLRDFIEDATKGTDISMFNLNRAADIISSFKLIAVDQSSDHHRTVYLHAYLNEIMVSLQPKIKKYKHSIDIQCDEKLQVHCRTGALVQIITNLVMNSIIHGFADKEAGQISIKVEAKNNNVQLFYKDDGCGLSKQAMSKLFDPFYTTKRGEGGSGLGTHLVYNLVVKGLGGKITPSSELGKGLAYHIEFPIYSKA